MLKLKNQELWFHVNCKDEFRIFGREAAIALMNWLLAVEKKLCITSLNQNLLIEFCIVPVKEYVWEKANDYTIVFCVPEDIMKFIMQNVENGCKITIDSLDNMNGTLDY